MLLLELTITWIQTWKNKLTLILLKGIQKAAFCNIRHHNCSKYHSARFILYILEHDDKMCKWYTDLIMKLGLKDSFSFVT